MKDKIAFLIVLGLFITFCISNKPFHQTVLDNPEFIPNTLFIYYNDSSYYKFRELKEKFKLDSIFHGEQDEFRRILLLRHWIHEVIPVTPDGVVNNPGDGTAEGILDEALKGDEFHCAYFMIVHAEVMNACGYQARVINADEGELNLSHQIAHHGTNEVWSNNYHKWFFSDAMFDCHFEKDGIPLSALEIRDEYFKNKAAEVTMVYGPERKTIDIYPDKNKRTKEIFTRVFTWIAWFKQSDIYSNWDNGISYMIMFEDDYFNTHKWIRADGKPHWAYGSRYLILSKDRKEIYWTPNTITSDVEIMGTKARIRLYSKTPNLKSYQMKEGSESEWKYVLDSLEVPLKNSKNEWIFRTVNLEGVTGAEHKILIEQ